MSFSVQSRETDNAIVRLAVFGRLDAATDRLLQQAMRKVLAADAVKGIIVDLDGVTVDEAGVRAIEHSQRIAVDADVPFLVVNAHGNQTRSTLDNIGILTATSKP